MSRCTLNSNSTVTGDRTTFILVSSSPSWAKVQRACRDDRDAVHNCILGDESIPAVVHNLDIKHIVQLSTPLGSCVFVFRLLCLRSSPSFPKRDNMWPKTFEKKQKPKPILSINGANCTTKLDFYDEVTSKLIPGADRAATSTRSTTFEAVAGGLRHFRRSISSAGKTQSKRASCSETTFSRLCSQF